MATSASVDVLLGRLRSTYAGAASPERAAGMRAYMRDQFPFLGLATPARRTLARTVLAGLPTPDPDDLAPVVLACWELPEREYQYFACDYLRRWAALATPSFVPVLETLVTTKPWWDTVDSLAAHVAGPLVRHFPTVVATMDTWVRSDNIWLARVAILHQLTYKRDTVEPRLFAYCDAQLDHPDFFIRKAIGWALRQYAHTNPSAVRAYVASRQLSPLSRREALKNL